MFSWELKHISAISAFYEGSKVYESSNRKTMWRNSEVNTTTAFIFRHVITKTMEWHESRDQIQLLPSGHFNTIKSIIHHRSPKSLCIGLGLHSECCNMHIDWCDTFSLKNHVYIFLDYLSDLKIMNYMIFNQTYVTYFY